MDKPVASTVGHDDGRIVLHLERTLSRSADEARRVIARKTRAAYLRWEVDDDVTARGWRLRPGSDVDSVDAAAIASADHHACFERVATVLDTGSQPPPYRCASFMDLVTRYGTRIAAALADTD